MIRSMSICVFIIIGVLLAQLAPPKAPGARRGIIAQLGGLERLELAKEQPQGALPLTLTWRHPLLIVGVGVPGCLYIDQTLLPASCDQPVYTIPSAGVDSRYAALPYRWVILKTRSGIEIAKAQIPGWVATLPLVVK